jgi:hypothetical protein
VRAADIVDARAEDRRRRIADALRAEWRMIATVSLSRCEGDEGFEADISLDPIVVKASLEQQGYPSTPQALARADARRFAALTACVDRLNATLEPAEKISRFQVAGYEGG